MNVIRATLNKNTSRGRPRRGRNQNNVPQFHTFFQRASGEQSSKSLMSSSDNSTLQQLHVRPTQGQVLGAAERNSSSSHSTEQVFRTPNLSLLKKIPATSDLQISNELVAEYLNTPDVPTSDSSNSKISVRHKERLRNIPPLCSGDGARKPRSSTSSGARPRSTLSHSTSGTPKTPRTPKTTSSSLESAQNMIIAITEGRGLARGEVGMAAMDTHRPYLILCQISDCQTYTSTLTKINVLHPTEILVPNTFIDSQDKNKLLTLIHESFPQVPCVTVERRHFSDNTGLQHVQSLCLTECANVEMVVREKFYALSAAAALLKYIEFQKNIIFMPKSLRIDYQSPENVMSIDMKTAQKLELVMSLNGRGAEGSLLGVVDHCCTVGGKRLLRANVLQPPTKLDIINSRLLSVTELAQNPALLHSLQSAVSKFCDAEQLLWLCVQVPNFKDEQRASELQTNFVLLLKTTLESLTVLRESLQAAQTPYFRKVLQDLDNEKFGLIMNTILEVVNDDAKTKKGYAASTFQRCFAIKTGINGLLDLERASYSDLVAKLNTRVMEMADEFGLPLRTCSTSNKGFHIQLSIKRNMKFSAKDLPSVFIQVARTRNLITMTTEELVVLNHRIKDILIHIQMLSNVTRNLITMTTEELVVLNHRIKDILIHIQMLSNEIMQDLLRKLRTHISCLYCLCENISELDLLISFAQVSSADNFTPPTFGNKMDIKSSRHPILDVISSSTPVANDVFASPEKNFDIITGPNMGGKSIYIKQVALLQVMAQMGCFVPAESAELRITKKIFSRIGFDDSIEYNASSFVMEMQEMQYILRSLVPDCLIVIDELCRSTDYEEGTAVAWVLCEQLLQSKAFVFFTTHYLTLTKLQSLYPNVANHQMVAEDGPHGRLVYTHQLRPGVTRVVMYGLRLAELSALPASLRQRARELCNDLAADRLEGPFHDEQKTEAEEDQEYIQELLNLIENNKFNVTEVSTIQLRLKQRYGLDDKQNEELQGRDEIIDESENDGENNITNDDIEKIPFQDPRTPCARNNPADMNESIQLNSSTNRSTLSPCISPRKSLQIKTQDSNHSRPATLNESGSQNRSFVQVSPIVQDVNYVADNTTDPQYSAKACSLSLNRQIHNSSYYECPNSKNENFSRTKPSTVLRADSQNSTRVSPHYSLKRTNSTFDNLPTMNQSPVYQNRHVSEQPCDLFQSQNKFNNADDDMYSFSNNIRSHNTMQLEQSYSPSVSVRSTHRGDGQSTFSSPQPVFTSLNRSIRNVPPHIPSEHLDYDHNCEVLSPVLDENSDFQINKILSPVNDSQHRAPGCSSRPVMSSRPSPYPRPASTPGRLSGRMPLQSPSSLRSQTQMVLSLEPNFDLIPRHINSGHIELSDDDNYEE